MPKFMAKNWWKLWIQLLSRFAFYFCASVFLGVYIKEDLGIVFWKSHAPAPPPLLAQDVPGLITTLDQRPRHDNGLGEQCNTSSGLIISSQGIRVKSNRIIEDPSPPAMYGLLFYHLANSTKERKTAERHTELLTHYTKSVHINTYAILTPCHL